MGTKDDVLHESISRRKMWRNGLNCQKISENIRKERINTELLTLLEEVLVDYWDRIHFGIVQSIEERKEKGTEQMCNILKSKIWLIQKRNSLSMAHKIRPRPFIKL